jgi:hypothetical protein
LRTSGESARPKTITFTAMGARRQAESGQEKSRQAPLRPDAPARPMQLNMRTTILLTISKGIFFHEDLGS